MGSLSEILGLLSVALNCSETGRGNSSMAVLEVKEKWEFHPSSNIVISASQHADPGASLFLL